MSVKSSAAPARNPGRKSQVKKKRDPNRPSNDNSFDVDSSSFEQDSEPSAFDDDLSVGDEVDNNKHNKIGKMAPSAILNASMK